MQNLDDNLCLVFYERIFIFFSFFLLYVYWDWSSVFSMVVDFQQPLVWVVQKDIE